MKTLRTASLVTALLLTGGWASAVNLFFDDFESGNLNAWTGKNGGATSGQIVDDPLAGGPNQVLHFDEVTLGGDAFSIDAVSSPSGQYVFSFDYLGCSVQPSEPGSGPCEGGSDLGGFAGVSTSLDTASDPHYWFAGTNTTYVNGVPGVALIDDGQWHQYTIFFSGVGTDLHVMLEDFSFSGTTAGDAYFDNVRLEAVPEPGSLVLIGSGLAGLALRRRRRS